MKKVDSPQALPGSCVQCGSASRSGWIDTGRSEEFHGAVYYCDVCVAEMARLFGFITPVEVAQFHETLDNLETELFNAQRKLAGLERAFNGLRDAGFCPDPSTHVYPDNQPSLAFSDGSSEEVDGYGSVDAPSGAADMGSGTGETPESVHDEGVAELHSSVSDDRDAGLEFQLDI